MPPKFYAQDITVEVLNTHRLYISLSKYISSVIYILYGIYIPGIYILYHIIISFYVLIQPGPHFNHKIRFTPESPFVNQSHFYIRNNKRDHNVVQQRAYVGSVLP